MVSEEANFMPDLTYTKNIIKINMHSIKITESLFHNKKHSYTASSKLTFRVWLALGLGLVGGGGNFARRPVVKAWDVKPSPQ